MKLAIWLVAIAGIVVWSFVAWAGHSVLNFSSNWAAANADQVSSVPEIVEWLSWALRSIGNAATADEQILARQPGERVHLIGQKALDAGGAGQE